MAETTYSWPARDATSVLGAEVERIDGIAQKHWRREIHLRRQPAQPTRRPRARLPPRPRAN